jgi:hypothetical protein
MLCKERIINPLLTRIIKDEKMKMENYRKYNIITWLSEQIPCIISHVKAEYFLIFMRRGGRRGRLHNGESVLGN